VNSFEERFQIACSRVAASGGCGKPYLSSVARLKALKAIEVNKLDPTTAIHRDIPNLNQCVFIGI
jgi:hypothetical protein